MSKPDCLRAAFAATVSIFSAHIAAAQVGPVTAVSLASADNVYAIANAGTANAGIGGDGYGYAAALLGTALTWNGENFSLGSAGAPSAATSTTISLPAGSFSALTFLGTGIYGNQGAQNFVVTYTDGTTTVLTQSLSDWSAAQNYPGESMASSMAYRITPSGATGAGTWNLYAYQIALNAAKTVKSLTLPANKNVVVLAVDLIAPAAVGGVTSVNLSAADTLYGIANNGTANGGIGNDGYSYSATLTGSGLYWSGASFALGAASAPSAAANATIALPSGNDASLSFLATAIYGNQPLQNFVVTYTDGTTTTLSQSISDWGSPQHYGGESVVATMAYRISPTGAPQAGFWNLYGYSMTLNGTKTVKSLTLPANAHVAVFGVDLVPAASATTLTAQTVSFAPIANQTVGGTLALGATASSGLAVSYASSTPSICTVAAGTASFIAAGTCTLVASQAGNSTYAAATPVTQSCAVTAPAVSAAATSVSLGAAANLYGIANNGTANGGIGKDGYSFSATLLGTSLAWNGLTFSLGTAAVPSAATSTTIALPGGNYTTLSFLATAVNGSQPNQSFVVTYADGTASTFVQGVSDWGAPQNYAGETSVSTMAYRVTPTGATGAGSWHLYGYAFALNPTKQAVSLTLPSNSHVAVFAVDLSLAPPHTTVCQAQTAASYCTDTLPGTADAGGYHDMGWVNLNKVLTAIAVSDDQVWGLDSAQVLWFLPNFKTSTAWLKVSSGVAQISAGHGLICQINANTHLLCSSSPNPAASTPDSNGFQSVTWFDSGATNFAQVAVSAGTQIWAIDANANLYQIKDYTHVSTTSTPVASGVKQVAVDGRGTICQVNANAGVYCSDWSAPAATPTSGYYGLPWVATGDQLTHIAVADGQVWGQDSASDLWQLPDYANSTTWFRIAHGTAGTQLAAASPPSQFTPADFASGEVAVLMFMGQSNAVGYNSMPARFVAPATPNVFGIQNAGWNFLAGNTNGTTPFTGAISSIASVQWTNFALTPTGPDMNLGFNSDAGPGGDAANFAAFQWQGLVNAGWNLPNLYIIHIAWPSQGVDPADTTTAAVAWTTHGVNLWQPLLTASQEPSYALAPFARTMMYRGLQNLLASGKVPRVIGLQWNQWEAEAGNPNPVSITDAPANYSELFNAFSTAVGSSFPVQLVKPLSQAYTPAVLATMQSVFANLAAANPATMSIIDVSQVSPTIFSGGVLGGGDGAIHYNLDTHEWFAVQAIGACVTLGNCGTRIPALPASPPN